MANRVFQYADGRRISVPQVKYDRLVRAQRAAAARWGKVRYVDSRGTTKILSPEVVERRVRQAAAQRAAAETRRAARTPAPQPTPQAERATRRVIETEEIPGPAATVVSGRDLQEFIAAIIDQANVIIRAETGPFALSLRVEINGELAGVWPMAVEDGHAVYGHFVAAEEMEQGDWRVRLIAALTDSATASYLRATLSDAKDRGSFISDFVSDDDEDLPGDIDLAATPAQDSEVVTTFLVSRVRER